MDWGLSEVESTEIESETSTEIESETPSTIPGSPDLEPNLDGGDVESSLANGSDVE